MRTFTTDQLADRWYDTREIKNLVGKYVTSILLKREGEIFGAFWAGDSGVCLGLNDGWYTGAGAVAGYFAAVAENTKVKSGVIRGLFPEKLGGLSDEEIFGVGQLRALPLTTPVIELAGDGMTAKGIWHVLGADNDVTAAGPLSHWALGYLCADLIKEDGEWKLWHVLHADDINTPMGENWVKPQAHPDAAGFEAVKALGLPAFSKAEKVFEAYTPSRPFTAPPRLPEPYETFGETFSYGV